MIWTMLEMTPGDKKPVYATEMSTWEESGYIDPETGRSAYGWRHHLTPIKEHGEIVSWNGVLPSGSSVIVFND